MRWAAVAGPALTTSLLSSTWPRTSLRGSGTASSLPCGENAAPRTARWLFCPAWHACAADLHLWAACVTAIN